MEAIKQAMLEWLRKDYELDAETLELICEVICKEIQERAEAEMGQMDEPTFMDLPPLPRDADRHMCDYYELHRSFIGDFKSITQQLRTETEDLSKRQLLKKRRADALRQIEAVEDRLKEMLNPQAQS